MSIELNGFDEVVRRITKFEDLTKFKPALLAMGVHVKGKIDRYPLATEANNSSMPRWYERGYGPKWRRRDGTIGGRKTSETLGRKWAVEQRDAGMTVVVGNSASYSIYVHDEPRQAGFHARRGWPTAQKVVRDEGPTLIRFAEDEVDKILNR